MPESNNPNASVPFVDVQRPAAGGSASVASVPGGGIRFDFDPTAGSTITRPEGSYDLHIAVDGGGEVTLTGFFATGGRPLPNFILPGGEVVETTAALGPEGLGLDITTAAGPGSNAPASGGTNYDDNSGALIAGVDKFGMLGTDYWSRSTETGEELLGVADAFGLAGGDAVLTPPAPPAPEGPGGQFSFGSGFVLDESWLAGGTMNAGGNAAGARAYTFQSGSQQLTEAEYAQLTINGVNVKEAIGDGSDAVFKIDPNAPDGLVVRWDAAAGTLTYSYELTAREAHTDNAHTVGAGYQGALDNAPPISPNHWDEANTYEFTFKIGEDGVGQTLVVQVEDDGLGSLGELTGTADLNALPQAYDLMFCIDMSNSMLMKLGVPGDGWGPSSPDEFNNGDVYIYNGNRLEFNYGYEETRLFATQVAIIETLKAYAAQVDDPAHDLSISLVGFHNQAKDFGTFTNVDEAIRAVATMLRGYLVYYDDVAKVYTYVYDSNTDSPFPWTEGRTYYDTGLDLLVGKLDAAIANGDAVDRVYFLSDGLPAAGHGESSAWTDAIKAHQNAGRLGDLELYTVGLTGITDDYFDGVRADGTFDNADTHHKTIPHDADLKDFVDTLIDTTLPHTGRLDLPVTADGVLGVNENGTGKAFLLGVGSQTMDGIELDARGYPPATVTGKETCVIEHVYGTFTFKADGSYSFAASDKVNNIGYKKTVDITLNLTFMDADGDTLEVPFTYTITGPARTFSAGDVLIGGADDDILYGQEGDDILFGGELLYKGLAGTEAYTALAVDAGQASLSLQDYIMQNIDQLGQEGSADGNNFLHGGSGNDLLIGGAGNDTLSGGAGNDTLFGGAGDDTFVFAGESFGNDMVMDFQLGQDVLQFTDVFGGGDGDLTQFFKDHIELVRDGLFELTKDELSLSAKFSGSTVELELNGNSVIVVTDSPLEHNNDVVQAASLLAEMIRGSYI